MDRTASAGHASHDELLVARLYGGDVDAEERERALELIAECRDCADLFADLGVIAEAAAATRIPPRPRDFSLTEAEAARLRRRRLVTWFLGPGLRRSLGGSLAALGLVGVVLTGVSSTTSGTATLDRLASQNGGVPFAAAGTGAESGAFGGAGAPTAAPAATPAPALLPAASNELSVATTAPSVAGASPAATPQTESSPAPLTSAGGQGKASPPGQIPGGAGQPTTGVPAQEATQGGIDARTVGLAGFGALFAIGLAIAILPSRRRGRGRGDRS